MSGDAAMRVPTDEELLLSLKNFEDNFVERKTVSDSRDWLKTAVAFANSVPIDFPAVMFVGVKDDGSVQVGKVNLETIERSVSEEIGKAYPPIYHFHRVLRDASINPFLAVIIPGSALRPHFAGQAYIRIGSDSKPASEPQFQNLIAQRQSKAYEILKWKGRVISAESVKKVGYSLSIASFNPAPVITDCNTHYVTISQGTGQEPIYVSSHPLDRVAISYDNEKHRLKLEFRED
jgi:predicted HTH transcriptional regulator